MTSLAERWENHIAALGADAETAAPYLADILAAYGAPERRYHGLGHLEHLFAEIDAIEGELVEKERVWFAAWFHDLVYDTTRADNETRSADKAREALAALGAAPDFIDRVARLIEATADHLSGGADTDDDLFLDIDFSILGAPDAIYDRYVENVRAEYAWVDEALWRQGRGDFLQKALTARRVFLTDRFEQRLGEQARANMRRELARMGT